MAVSVDVVEQKINEILVATERILDERLRAAIENSNVTSRVWVSTSGLRNQVIEALIPKYKAAGWEDIEVYDSSVAFTFDLQKILSKISQDVKVTSPDILLTETTRQLKV